MVIKVKEISIGRGRKYTQNYQSVDYHIGVTVEGTTAKDTIEDMRKAGIEALNKLEIEEQSRCRDVIDIINHEETREFTDKVEKSSGKNNVIKNALEPVESLSPDSKALPELKSVDPLKKQPKTTKKIPANGQYKVAGSPCNRCNGYITWDGWVKGNPPVHVDVEGKILGNGDCPNFEGGG